MKAYKTKREAQKEADRQNGGFRNDIKVWHKRGDKRKKPYFVGSYLEWLNK